MLYRELKARTIQLLQQARAGRFTIYPRIIYSLPIYKGQFTSTKHASILVSNPNFEISPLRSNEQRTYEPLC